jgi:hypothetical protein
MAMKSTGTAVSVAEAFDTRREPTTLTLWMGSSFFASGAVCAMAEGLNAASAALPYSASRTALRMVVSLNTRASPS